MKKPQKSSLLTQILRSFNKCMQTWQKMNQIEAFMLLNCELKRLVHINGEAMKKCHHNYLSLSLASYEIHQTAMREHKKVKY
jgi:polyhydroxyalkanoate synthesis regulator protein